MAASKQKVSIRYSEDNPCRGVNKDIDPSIISRTELTVGINARVKSGVVVCRGGQSKRNSDGAMDGAVFGLIDTEGEFDSVAPSIVIDTGLTSVDWTWFFPSTELHDHYRSGYFLPIDSIYVTCANPFTAYWDLTLGLIGGGTYTNSTTPLSFGALPGGDTLRIPSGDGSPSTVIGSGLYRNLPYAAPAAMGMQVSGLTYMNGPVDPPSDTPTVFTGTGYNDPGEFSTPWEQAFIYSSSIATPPWISYSGGGSSDPAYGPSGPYDSRILGWFNSERVNTYVIFNSFALTCHVEDTVTSDTDSWSVTGNATDYLNLDSCWPLWS